MANQLEDGNLNRFLATNNEGGPTVRGVDLEGNPLLPVSGETIDSLWGQSVVGRVIPRFSTAAVRDATILSPDQGQLCYVLEVDELHIWDGTGWVEVPDVTSVGDLIAAAPYLPINGGLLTGPLSIAAGAIDTVDAGHQNIVRDVATGEINRYNLTQQSVPLINGNSGDARLDIASDMVTVSFTINTDTLNANVATVDTPYRPQRDYRFQAVLVSSGGVTQKGSYACRIRTSGALRAEGGDTPPSGGTINGVVTYPWSQTS